MGMRQLDAREAPCAIVLVQAADGPEMVLQGIDEGGGKDGHAVLAALAVADREDAPGEIEVLHPQLEAFVDAQSGAVKHAGDQRVPALHACEHRGDLVPREHGRQPLGAPRTGDAVHPWKLDAQHLAVEEEERGQRLVLRGGRDLPTGRQ